MSFDHVGKSCCGRGGRGGSITSGTDGCVGARGGEVIGRGVVLGVFKSSLWENYGGAIGVFREESSEVDGGLGSKVVSEPLLEKLLISRPGADLQNSGPNAKLPILKLGNYEMYLQNLRRWDNSYIDVYHCTRQRRKDIKRNDVTKSDNTTKAMETMEDTSKAMLVIDGASLLRVIMAEEEQVQTTWLLWHFQTQSEFEKVKQEKEGIKFKIEKFDKASKDLEKLLGSQITDKSKKGLGYNVVPPRHPLIYNRPKKLDLSYSSLDEFKEPEFKGYSFENSKQDSNIVCDKKSDDSKENSDDSLVKEQDHMSKVALLKITKVLEGSEKSGMVRSQTIGSEFVMLTRTPVNTVRPRIVNTARSYRTPVNTVRPRVVNTARPNRTSVNAARANGFNAGKPQHDDKGFVDSRCSRHMTGNIAYLSDFK
ncbi:hypothetical protein Tco_0646791 [Tanacetum coccineum]